MHWPGEECTLGVSCLGIVVSLLTKGSAKGSESSIISLKDESSSKYTLSAMMILCFVGSHNQYTFWPSAYPSMIHWTDVASNFFWFTFGMYAQTIDPNVHRLCMDGFLPDHTLIGVLFPKGDDGLWFDRYTAVFTALAQNPSDIPAAFSIHLAHSTIVLLALSARPFCSGVCGTEVWWEMPCWERKLLNFGLVYSPPLSVCRVLIVQPISLSAIALNSMNLSNTWSFEWRK